MSNIAIIPARGGSKRIPRKNIKDFLGKPIIAYSIESAISSCLFDEVMVSTDDEEIAEIAIKYGANVPFYRTKATSNDYASTTDVLTEVIEEYKKKMGLVFDKALCLYATAPLVTIESLKRGYSKLITGDFDSVFPVVAFSYPIQRGLHFTQEKIEMLWKENLMARSQDLEPTFHDAGQYYFFDVPRFMKNKKLWTDNTSAITLSELEVQDIDMATDWTLAEIKYRLLNK